MKYLLPLDCIFVRIRDMSYRLPNIWEIFPLTKTNTNHSSYTISIHLAHQMDNARYHKV